MLISGEAGRIDGMVDGRHSLSQHKIQDYVPICVRRLFSTSTQTT